MLWYFWSWAQENPLCIAWPKIRKSHSLLRIIQSRRNVSRTRARSSSCCNRHHKHLHKHHNHKPSQHKSPQHPPPVQQEDLAPADNCSSNWGTLAARCAAFDTALENSKATPEVQQGGGQQHARSKVARRPRGEANERVGWRRLAWDQTRPPGVSFFQQQTRLPTHRPRRGAHRRWYATPPPHRTWWCVGISFRRDAWWCRWKNISRILWNHSRGRICDSLKIRSRDPFPTFYPTNDNNFKSCFRQHENSAEPSSDRRYGGDSI